MKLNEGEVICGGCKGSGVVRAWNVAYTAMKTVVCGQCKGKGKIDWITNIMPCNFVRKGELL